MHYETIVLGASVYGIAATSKSPINTLIIEPSLYIASEFASSMKNNRFRKNDIISENGNWLYREFEKRNLIGKDGAIHIAPAGAILSGFALSKGIEILLCTAIVSITETKEGYTVTCFHSEGNTVHGYFSLTAKKILDTRSECDYFSFPFQKYLCAALYCEYNRSILSQAEFQFVKGRFEGEYTLRMPTDAREVPVARKQLIERFLPIKDSVELFGVRLASIAPVFLYEYENKGCRFDKNENYQFSPSASYDNVFTAFEGGLACNFVQ